MPIHFKLQEPLTNFEIDTRFKLNSGMPMFEFLRLLCGTVNLMPKDTGKVVSFRQCYLTQAPRRLKRSTISELVGTWFDDDLSLDDFLAYLDRGGRENTRFWEDAKAELCHCIYANKKGKFLNSFLHLYRTLELISVALPLVYASSEPDYKKALMMLSSLKENPRDGELAIFRKFVRTLAAEGGYNHLKITFQYTQPDAQWQQRMSDQLTKYLSSVDTLEILSDQSGAEVNFSDVPSLVIEVRNKLFHRTQSGESFDLDAVRGADPICSTMIPSTLYFLSLVSVEILKSHARRFV